ncbi:MAG: DUF427 domain-containing protein [Actinobacteria bacterium]|nr:DUF427 domain-containing protein [Actinomycetota bacterium]
MLKGTQTQGAVRRALWGDTVLAESAHTQRVDGYEYFPPHAVRWELLEKAPTPQPPKPSGRIKYDSSFTKRISTWRERSVECDPSQSVLPVDKDRPGPSRNRGLKEEPELLPLILD